MDGDGPLAPLRKAFMARPLQTEVRMRLVVERPVAGVLHSLQDKKNHPVDAKLSAGGEPIMFDFPIRIASGPKFYGEQVRSEGPLRRFVYIAVGQQAGDRSSCWSRRMKIDIHDIAPALLDGAMRGKRLVGKVAGTGADGTPACATVRAESWRLD
jgi:hypothetical protein